MSLSPIPGAGGLPRLALASPAGDRAEVYLHGAHVTSWVPAGGSEALFVSRRAAFDGAAPIRGGVPVVFPQFAEMGPLPKHGFARTAEWRLGDMEPHTLAPDALATLTLRDTPATQAIWPHVFRAEMGVRIADRTLFLRLAVTNNGSALLSFTAALHTYLRVADIRRTVVHGLEGTRYVDKVAGGAERTEEQEEIRFDSQVDRIYLDAPRHLLVGDEAGERGFEIKTRGFPDVVLWNPWSDGSAKFPDMDPEEYREFVCVEAAYVGKPVELDAGESWIGRQTIECRW